MLLIKVYFKGFVTKYVYNISQEPIKLNAFLYQSENKNYINSALGIEDEISNKKYPLSITKCPFVKFKSTVSPEIIYEIIFVAATEPVF